MAVTSLMPRMFHEQHSAVFPPHLSLASHIHPEEEVTSSARHDDKADTHRGQRKRMLLHNKQKGPRRNYLVHR